MKNSIFYLLFLGIIITFYPASDIYSHGNRFIPTLTIPQTHDSSGFYRRPCFSFGVIGGQATKSFAYNPAHKDKLLVSLSEIEGPYDLNNSITSLEITRPGYESPFTQETGAYGWIGKSIPFDVQSTFSYAGYTLSYQQPFGKTGIMLSCSLPFYQCTARDKYTAPLHSVAGVSLKEADSDQFDRMRRIVHSDLGLEPGDWVDRGIGDCTVQASYGKKWDYVSLLRSCSLRGELGVTVPLGMKKNKAYPRSVPMGSSGHWGLSVSLTPIAEIKEGIFIGVPFSFYFQDSAPETGRIAVYKEPSAYSPLVAPIRVKPGIEYSVLPYITFAHLVKNVHISLGYNYRRHGRDKLFDDIRTPAEQDASQSYLTISPSATRSERDIEYNTFEKRVRTGWESSYLTLRVGYEMADLFPRITHPPVLQIQGDYCFSGAGNARTHQLSASIGWRF